MSASKRRPLYAGGVKPSFHRADAALGLGSRDLSVTSPKEGTHLAFVLDSQRRYQGARNVYQKMPKQWRDDQQAQEVTPLFSPQNGK